MREQEMAQSRWRFARFNAGRKDALPTHQYAGENLCEGPGAVALAGARQRVPSGGDETAVGRGCGGRRGMPLQ